MGRRRSWVLLLICFRIKAFSILSEFMYRVQFQRLTLRFITFLQPQICMQFWLAVGKNKTQRGREQSWLSRLYSFIHHCWAPPGIWSSSSSYASWAGACLRRISFSMLTSCNIINVVSWIAFIQLHYVFWRQACSTYGLSGLRVSGNSTVNSVANPILRGDREEPLTLIWITYMHDCKCRKIYKIKNWACYYILPTSY